LKIYSMRLPKRVHFLFSCPQLNVELSRIIRTRGDRLSPCGDLKRKLSVYEKHIAELERERADSRVEVSRLEQELLEANTSKFQLNTENERLKDSQILAEEQLVKARSLLTEAEKARATAAAEVLEKTRALAKLKQDYEAETSRSAKKENELFSRIESALASRAASEKEMECTKIRYEAEIAEQN
jgi:chromosome segregation ATPase